MRALVVREPRRIDVARVPDPRAARGQLLIRMHGCGVCGSNLPVWEGRPWFSYPLAPGAPGHEGWGEVAATGDDVRDWSVGQPVAVLSYHAFADYDVAEADNVVALPAALTGAPLPAEALACAVNVMARSRIGPGDAVAIVGIGFLGALLVQLARHAGARVTVIGRRRFALDLAVATGAHGAVELTKGQDVVAAARTSNGGADFDCAIEAAGVQATLDVAAALTRERGTLVIAGYHQDGLRQVDMQSWNWRGIDVINAHERDAAVYVAGMRQAVSLVASGALDLSRLLTHVYPLDAASEAFHAAETRPEGFLKAVVRCDA